MLTAVSEIRKSREQNVVVFIATEVCLYVYSKLPMGNLFLLLLIRLVALYTRLSVAVNGLYNGKSQCFRCFVISLARGSHARPVSVV